MTRRLALLPLAWLLCAASVPPPADLDARAGFDQHLGTQLPLQTSLRNAEDRAASLGDRLHGHPAIMALGYFECRHLCDTVMQSMAHAVARAGLQPGRDVEVIFLSIDPREGTDAAARARERVGRSDPRTSAGQWQFLRATPGALQAITRPLGFRYFRDARLGEYIHPSGLVVITPDGRIAQYLFGVEYQPQALRLAVVDASRGTLGSWTDRLVLLCCGYDPSTGRYSLLIGKLMRVLGVAFAALLLTVTAWSLRRHRA